MVRCASVFWVVRPGGLGVAPMGHGGERLLGWYSAGDTEYRLPGTEMVFKVSAQTAELLRETRTTTGALVTGRRTFDLTHGWGGRHPLDVPLFVVSHTVPQEWLSSCWSPPHGNASRVSLSCG